MIVSESMLSKSILIGAGSVGLLVAAIEAAPTEVLAKVAPTPWEAIITASLALSTLILRKYTAPEKKLDEHNTAVQAQLASLISDGKAKESADLKWKLETSHVLGGITVRQEDQGHRLNGLEQKTAELLRENRK